MKITRRIFLRNGVLAAVGTVSLPRALARATFCAAEPAIRNKRLIVIFQRGAADGLNIVIPHAEPQYYAMRPTIKIPRKSVIDLDGFFGLHPAMAAFQPLWQQKHLSIVHAAGSPDSTRSHFEAQDFMESGTPGFKATDDGWLNRLLSSLPAAQKSPFRAIALASSLPRILSGSEPALALNHLTGFSVSEGRFKHSPVITAWDAMKILNPSNLGEYKPAAGAHYPSGRFADSLRQLAQLIKLDLGVQLAFADVDGWDHHVNEGSTDGQMANALKDFTKSLAAFWMDLGDLGEDTVIVTMSEFGRTARENCNRGTDHGHAGVMFVLGGPVKGGKVYGCWPGLDPSQLHEGRDLALTTDFRQVVGEAVVRHMGNRNLREVFPGFENPTENFLNIFA